MNTPLRRVRVPLASSIEKTLEQFSHSGRVLFTLFAIISVVSSIALLYTLNNAYLVTVPATGGTLTEGIIGSPRFINPVLAISDPDRDLTSLVYSGLMRALPEGGYKPDLASSYTVSEDGLVYTVNIRPEATFSDGEPMTADDVIFTVEKARNPSLKSSLRANWGGVTVAKTDDHTLTFTLQQPYAPFIKNLTLGILPEHLWSSVSDEEFPFSNLNVNPVGSGPMQISNIARSPGGIPESYTLKPFDDYAGGDMHLTALTLRFYQSEAALEEALRDGTIESASGITPDHLSLLPTTVARAPLNRVYGVFFNQNQSDVLRDTNVRIALSQAINREALVQEVLGGYGTPVIGPLPSDQPLDTEVEQGAAITIAREMLVKDGWVLKDGILEQTIKSGKSTTTQALRFTIATGDIPELRAAAQYVSKVWKEMGADVTVEVFNQGDLAQNVIRPRQYDALLFGEVVGREPDLYAFWSSTERNNPGLNIAQYTNPTADQALKELRQTSDPTTRETLYATLKEQLLRDMPAVFLYAPDFVYSTQNDIQGMNLGVIETPNDRFLSIVDWHRETDRVWPFFVRER